jgi:iron complex outermembrane receptor protein
MTDHPQIDPDARLGRLRNIIEARPFRFVGGLRYSNTERWFEDNSYFNVFVDVPPTSGGPIPGVAISLPLRGAGKQNKEWDFITWRGGFEFEPTDDSLLYVSYSRGEQAGGFNYLAVEPVVPVGGGPLTLETIPPFDSETIYALEGGAKTQFLDDRLQVNLAAYHYNYKNKFITRTIASGITETMLR